MLALFSYVLNFFGLRNGIAELQHTVWNIGEELCL